MVRIDYESRPLARPGRTPLAELLVLAGPTVLQHASYPVMQFIDTWMLATYGGQVSPEMAVQAPTAAANAGFFALSIMSLGMGVLWVVNTLVSQNFGHGTYRECGRYLWQGFWFSLLFAVLLLPALPFAERFFHAFGHEWALVELEGVYFRIALYGVALHLLHTTAAQFCIAIQRPMIVLVATVVGFFVNLSANWLLIFGNVGLPRLGVTGAAWGTNIGLAATLAVLAGFILLPSIRRSFNVLDWRPRRHEMTNLLRVGIPSGIQFTADILAWALFTVWVMAHFGTEAMAANTFMMRYMAISFMPAIGIGTAITALVGNYIGRGLPEEAVRRANLGFLLIVLYMLSCGLVFFLWRHQLIGLFTDDPEVLRIGAMLLVFAAIYQFADALYIAYNGALRGAGDTLVPALITAVLCWGMILGLGFLSAVYLPQLGVAGPWAIATTYGIILGMVILWRFRSGRWRKIHLTENDPM